jgi:alanyl-tRNA synthetase
MGFERLLSILQNKMSNYDTDVFMPLFGAISEVTGAPAYEGKYGEEDPTKKDMAYRVVADHIRTLSFSITDGALPGPVGRGFVLRRILRRAVRYGRDFLGAKVGFFSQLVPAFVKNFGGFFTEINESAERVAKVLYAEEVKFAQSYEKGIATFQSIVKDMKPGDVIPGEKVFLLYNTSGFPDDLTRIMGEERGLTIDVADFERRLNELRRASRAAQKAKAAANSLKLDAEHVAELKSKFAPTNDSFKHEILNIESKVIALFNGKNFSETKISVSENLVGVVLDSTNFYAESGGQLFDSGVLFADGVKFTVDDVQAFGGYILHIGRVSEGEVSVGSTVVCEVDNDRRTPIMSNHTATHMVNFALRTTLGSHVEQQGSTVGPDRLRFDYSHVGTVSKDNLKKADDIVCSLIAKELKVYARELPLDVATQITGIRKMFGEKYPNPVRVVSIGVSIDKIVADPANAEWANYPIELCGGTHLANVSQAQLFTIISDETVAQGVRRLVALTGDAANKAVIRAADLERKFEEIKNIKDANQKRDKFNLFVEELGKSKIPAWRKLALREAMEPVQKDILEAGKNRGKNQEKEAEEFGPKVVEELAQSKSSLYVHIMNVGGNNDVLSKTAKHIAEKSEHPVAVALLSVDDAKKGKERVICVAQVHATLVEKGLKANEWASAIAAVLGGKGGGRPNVAQGSGPAFEKVQAAFEEAKKFAQGKL